MPKPKIALVETIPDSRPRGPSLRQFLVQRLGMSPESVLGSASPLLGATRAFFPALCRELGVELDTFRVDQTACGGDWDWIELHARVKVR